MEKTNKLMSIVAFTGALCGVFQVHEFLGIFAYLGNTNLYFYYLIILILALLGLVGIYLFEHDYRIAVIEYILVAIGMLAFVRNFCILTTVLYVIAAFLAYAESDKSKGLSFKKKQTTTHYYGPEDQKPEQPEVTNQAEAIDNLDIKLLIVPLITLILVIFGYVIIY